MPPVAYQRGAVGGWGGGRAGGRAGRGGLPRPLPMIRGVQHEQPLPVQIERGAPVTTEQPVNRSGPPALPATPGAAAAQPGGQGGGTPQTSPLDSTYFLNVAAHNAQVANRINALNQAGGFARADLQRALGQLTQKEPLDIEKSRESYNRQGLLYSGHLGQALGLLGQSYADRQAGLQSNFARTQAARDEQIASLRSGQPFYDQGQYLAALARSARAAQTDPTLGVAPPVAPGASPGAPGGVLPATPTGPGGVQRELPVARPPIQHEHFLPRRGRPVRERRR